MNIVYTLKSVGYFFVSLGKVNTTIRRNEMNGMTIEQLLSKFSETTADQWQNLGNGAWVHEDAYVSPTAWIKSPEIGRAHV